MFKSFFLLLSLALSFICDFSQAGGGEKNCEDKALSLQLIVDSLPEYVILKNYSVINRIYYANNDFEHDESSSQFKLTLCKKKLNVPDVHPPHQALNTLACHSDSLLPQEPIEFEFNSEVSTSFNFNNIVISWILSGQNPSQSFRITHQIDDSYRASSLDESDPTTIIISNNGELKYFSATHNSPEFQESRCHYDCQPSADEQGDITITCELSHDELEPINLEQYTTLGTVTKLTQDMSAEALLQIPPLLKKPQESFIWLNQQSNRLLNYFNTDRVFHQCLSPQQRNVSSNCESITQQLQNEANHFCEEANALLSGYEQFLAFAGNTDNALISDYRNELTVLKRKLIELTNAVKKQTANMSFVLQHTTGALEPNHYEEWLAQCQHLKSILQHLIKPQVASEINSLHDLIFFTHKRFFGGLPVIAEQSGQGRVNGFEYRDVRSFGFRSINGKWTQFVKDGEDTLVNADIVSALKTLDSEVTIFDIPTVFHLNARIDNYICEAAMIEQDKTDNSRRIKLSFSDELIAKHTVAKTCRRYFFLVSALRACDMDPTCMTLKLNQEEGKLSLDYTPIASREEMQRLYELCLLMLAIINNLDWRTHDNKAWDFASLETKLKQSEWDIDSFMKLLFSINYKHETFYTRLNQAYKRLNELEDSMTDWRPVKTDLLINAYKMFSEKDQQRELKAFINVMVIKRPKTILPLLRPYPELMALLDQDNIPIKYVVGKTDNPQHVTNALCLGEANVFDHVSEKLIDNREFILEQIKQHPQAMKTNINGWSRWHKDKDLMGEAFLHRACDWKHLDENWKNDKQFILHLISPERIYPEDVSDQLLKDRDVILAFLSQKIPVSDVSDINLKSFSDDQEIMLKAVSAYFMDCQYASDRLKNDQKFINEAVKINGYTLAYFSDTVRDDIDVVKTACNSDACALQYASDRLREDKSIVLAAVSKRGIALKYASDKLKNDPDVFIAAINQDYRAYNYAGSAWKQNREAVLAAVKGSRHPYILRDILRDIGKNIKDDAEIISEAIKVSPNFYYASDRLKNDKKFVMEALSRYSSAIFSYVSNPLKEDHEVVLAALRRYDEINDIFFPLRFAHSNLLSDENFITEAVKLTPKALDYASDELRNNSSFVKKLLHIDNRVLSYASDTLKTDQALMDYRDQVSILNTAIPSQ
ncbi:MAG: DUF4116 domain-containing protein [Endozoicomonas sp. (ex Botrylloides leachii)]|nr:DUF4116 domain-containing protein [Endozoicomonas sp. (ex Botrylloides leachii)]